MTRKRKAIPKEIKDKLLVEAMHRCCLCPEHQDITDFHHIILISEGGPNSEENLMVVCPTCHAKIHRIRGRYTPTQLKMYKERWVNICALRLPTEELLTKAPGIILDSLHNQTPPEPNFVGRDDMLKTITEWYNDRNVRIGALVGWGGVGKSALVRKWYDSLQEYKINPDGIFWWGFYRNAYLDQFLNALLRYVSQADIDPDAIKSTWEKIDRIKECIFKRAFLIILDGLEQMQKSESGDEFGRMMHRECTELLHWLADQPKAGLCLITTRFPLKDLDNWCETSYKHLPLVDLSVPDALAMLKKRGVKGEDQDLEDIIGKYKGHALSLTSVAGYLKRYHDGDIKHAPDIQFVFSDEERFKDVNKLLKRYAEKMSQPELSFLNIFSLFRKDVTEKEFEGAFQHNIEGTRFNDLLVKMSELGFKDLVSGLVEWRLISYDESKKSYTTHPLIKTYFESHFDEKERKLCHKRIYHYFGEHAPKLPDTLEEMQPLFEQVYHGCGAELYDEVLHDIYWEKINRESEFFITYKLGAWETNLSLAKTFFPQDDLSRLPLVSRNSAQRWLFDIAGLALLCIGRPKEGEQPLLTAVNMAVDAKDWINGSAGYQNLSDVQFRIGKIKEGLESAKRALELAEKAGSDWNIMISKAYLGQILHLCSASKEAEKWFREADDIERKMSGDRLHSLRGTAYADFLISMDRIDEAYELTNQNIEICKENNWPYDISRCHRCLATTERIKGNYKDAKDHCHKAFELARKVGVPELEIEALLEYGRLYLDEHKYKEAINAGNEVLRICQRTGFLLYEPDAEVILAKVYLAKKDFEQAIKLAESAHSKAKKMSYKLAENDAENLLKEIELKRKGNKT